MGCGHKSVSSQKKFHESMVDEITEDDIRSAI